MNDLTERLVKNFKPRLAIVVHTSEMNDWRDAYLESHEIDEAGRILEGKPLKQETIQCIVDVFFDERQNAVAVSGLIPSNVLQFEILPGGRYSLIWHRPAERRQIFFAGALHIPSGQAWVPALLYQTDGRKLSVYALASDDRPTESTPLYRAPFHNIYTDGSVCLGSAQVKKPAQKTYANLMKYWEDLFWLSEFSHLNGSDNPTKTNLALLWKRLVKEKNLTWKDLGELIKIKKTTLNDIL
jgi:PRTRC genetic system protein B